jgi:hypothetical protein
MDARSLTMMLAPNERRRTRRRAARRPIERRRIDRTDFIRFEYVETSDVRTSRRQGDDFVFVSISLARE